LLTGIRYMKILILHNQYLIGGGEDVSTLAEVEMLRRHGHTVELLLLNNNTILQASRWSVALGAIWSKKAYQTVLQKVRTERYDIVHVQNFFPLLSPSIFFAAKKGGAKVILSLRNYRLMCPNAQLFTQDAICGRCVGKMIPLPGVTHKCYRDSYTASAVVATMLALHNFLGTWQKKIDGFICISDFVKKQMIEAGIPARKLFRKYNFISEDPGYHENPADDFLYVGRLSREKGIGLLLEAFSSPELAGRRLTIVGDGPLRNSVETAAAQNPNIRYLGVQDLKTTYRHMGEAFYLLFPSRWHEPFGRTIAEAFACGTPVIASDAGAASELVTDQYNGFLFLRDNVASLIQKIQEACRDEDYRQKRRNARESYLQRFTMEMNYSQLLGIYAAV
jgi:glycosyltransferase involved in cell wall biosynthesis